MKKLSLIVAGVVIAGFAGFAIADSDTTGNPGFGNQLCYYAPNDAGLVAKNPGKYFQALRTGDFYGTPAGLNPAQWQKYWDDPTATTVGEFIQRDCGQPN